MHRRTTPRNYPRSTRRWSLFNIAWGLGWFVFECYIIWTTTNPWWRVAAAVFAVFFLWTADTGARLYRTSKARGRVTIFGPPFVPPGQAPGGGIVIRVYGVPDGDLVIEQVLAADSERETILTSAEYAARAARGYVGISIVVYDGDTGQRLGLID